MSSILNQRKSHKTSHTLVHEQKLELHARTDNNLLQVHL